MVGAVENCRVVERADDHNLRRRFMEAIGSRMCVEPGFAGVKEVSVHLDQGLSGQSKRMKASRRDPR